MSDGVDLTVPKSAAATTSVVDDDRDAGGGTGVIVIVEPANWEADVSAVPRRVLANGRARQRKG